MDLSHGAVDEEIIHPTSDVDIPDLVAELRIPYDGGGDERLPSSERGGLSRVTRSAYFGIW